MNPIKGVIAIIGLGMQALLVQSAIAQPQQAVQLAENDQCIICHTDLEVMPESYIADNIHMQEGLSCAGCHGGDPTVDDEEEAKAPGTGFVGVPEFQAIPEFCGKCHSDIGFMRQYQPRIHTDQVDQYLTSQHGQKFTLGDEKVAQCVSCHTSHAILPASDARSSLHPFNVPTTCNQCHGEAEIMAESGLPTDQLSLFARSVHGISLLEEHDVGAPACNDCHGNHGATPPEIANIGQVCGTCHVNNERYFSQTTMAAEFRAEEIHACAECHGSHGVQPATDDMVGIGETSLCLNCHGEGEEAYDAASRIHQSLTGLATAYDSVRLRQAEVQRIGMDDVDIGFILQEANQSLIQARTLVHTFDPEQVKAETDLGQEKVASAAGLADTEIRNYNTRRRGFALATFFMLILIVALWFKIRDIEKR